MAATSSSSPEPIGANAILKRYLLERDDIFRQLHQTQIDAHNNPEADKHFEQQRQTADNADDKMNRIFYNMTEKVAKELDQATGALKIKCRTASETPMVLDLCMAPGGFSSAASQANPNAKLRAVTLPRRQGGHKVIFDKAAVDYTDITQLAAVMGLSKGDIPDAHPDAADFRFDLPFEESKFDLVFCDGQVLRTHERATYRERYEAARLQNSQLVLAFQRIRDGGTMVVKLHRVGQWHTTHLLYIMDKMADIQLFKPQYVWGKRGSFYLVAKNVQPHCQEAERAVRDWKAAWYRTTFDTQPSGVVNGAGEEAREALWDVPSNDVVEDLLADFGPKLIKMGRPIWLTQLEALRRAPWNKSGKSGRGNRGKW